MLICRDLLQAYVRQFQELFFIQDVFAEQVFVLAHSEQVSGISYHHDVLIKGFAFNDMHEPNQESREPFWLSPPRQTPDSLTGWSSEIVDQTNSNLTMDDNDQPSQLKFLSRRMMRRRKVHS